MNVGDEVEIQVDCQANLLEGTSISLDILYEEGGIPLVSRDFTISGDILDTTITLIIRPEQTGIEAFSVEAKCGRNELTQGNNTASFFIDVRMVDKMCCFVQPVLILTSGRYTMLFLSIKP